MNARYNQQRMVLNVLLATAFMLPTGAQGALNAVLDALDASVLGRLVAGIHGHDLINYSVYSAASAGLVWGLYKNVDKVYREGGANWWRDYIRSYYSSNRTISGAQAQAKLQAAFSTLKNALANSGRVSPYQELLTVGQAFTAFEDVYKDIIPNLSGKVNSAALAAQYSEYHRILAHPDLIGLFAQLAQSNPGLRSKLSELWKNAQQMINVGTAQAMHHTVYGTTVPLANVYTAAIASLQHGGDLTEVASTAIVETGGFLMTTVQKVGQKIRGKTAPQTTNILIQLPTTRSEQIRVLALLRKEIGGQKDSPENSWFKQIKNILDQDTFNKLLGLKKKSDVLARATSHSAPIQPAEVGVLVATQHAHNLSKPEGSNDQVVPDIFDAEREVKNSERMRESHVSLDARSSSVNPVLARMYALLAKTKTMDPLKAAQYGLVITTGLALTVRNFSVLTGAGVRVWNAWVDTLDCIITTSCKQVASAGTYVYHSVAGKKAHDQEHDQEADAAEDETENDTEIVR